MDHRGVRFLDETPQVGDEHEAFGEGSEDRGCDGDRVGHPAAARHVVEDVLVGEDVERPADLLVDKAVTRSRA